MSARSRWCRDGRVGGSSTSPGQARGRHCGRSMAEGGAALSGGRACAKRGGADGPTGTGRASLTGRAQLRWQTPQSTSSVGSAPAPRSASEAASDCAACRCSWCPKCAAPVPCSCRQTLAAAPQTNWTANTTTSTMPSTPRIGSVYGSAAAPGRRGAPAGRRAGRAWRIITATCDPSKPAAELSPASFKSRPGLVRLWRALLYSRDGLRAAVRHEAAFR